MSHVCHEEAKQTALRLLLHSRVGSDRLGTKHFVSDPPP